MDAVDLRCCMCTTDRGLPPVARNGQIHHLDGDASNGALDNLVYLCLNCHEEAGKRGRAARNWSHDLICRRRDRLVARIEAERQPSHHVSAGFRDALDALIVMDVRGLPTGPRDDWEAVHAALYEIQSYPTEMGVNARRAVLSFLYNVTGHTRLRMPSGVAASISSCTIDLLPIGTLQRKDSDLRKNELDLLETAAAIGGDLAYDGALYCRTLRIVEAGGEVLWRVLSYAKSRSLKNIEKVVNLYFEQAFDGAKRSTLPYAVELLELFKRHGMSRTWRRPTVPEEFLRAMADDET